MIHDGIAIVAGEDNYYFTDVFSDTVVLNLCSGTQLMDYKEHIRSFQKDNFTCSSLLDICSKEYEEPGRIMMEGNGKKIPHFIMQYRETDWEFIKRLAAMNHTVIFADCSTQGEKYHFGIPDRKFNLEETLCEYRTRYDMQEYWYKKDRGLSIHTEDTCRTYGRVERLLNLGERRSMDGREVFIWNIESSLKGNELYHTCYMKTCSGFQTASYNNKNMAGSLY